METNVWAYRYREAGAKECSDPTLAIITPPLLDTKVANPGRHLHRKALTQKGTN